jgi:hypothetical protein
MPSRTLSPDLRPTATPTTPAQAAPAQAAPVQATAAQAAPAQAAPAQATAAQAAPAQAAPAHPAVPVLARPAEPAASTDLPGLRLIAVPDAAPPYDCDTHGAACPAQPDPSWTNPSWADPSWADPYGAEVAPGPSGPHGPHGPDARPDASRAESAADAWPRQFAQVVVEILAGARSPRQILSCTTDHVREQIGLLAPLVTAGQRPRIQRILTSHPTAHAVEMTVVVSFGSRSRALAVRCEQLPPQPAAPGRPARPARWLCTELEAG